VAFHIREGILRAVPDAKCKLLPMADGGEGTVEALVKATNGKIEKVPAHDPLMRPVNAFIGISADGKTAFIEMAAASGLKLLEPKERNPLITTTYGTGELIKYTLSMGCDEIILGLGGSATIDGGVGMAQALGMKFKDEHGQEASAGGGSLSSIAEIDCSQIDSRIKQCRIVAACDVINPLTGPKGAAIVYGLQKGATPLMVKLLDSNLKHLARILNDSLGIKVEKLQGGGAAGGLGAGVVAFLNGELKPGFDLISKTVKLEEWINWADLIVTGEGKMDAQTEFGKTPAGVAKTAFQYKKPVIAFTGSLEGKPEIFYRCGFHAIIPIADKPMTLEQSILNAGRLLEDAAQRSFYLIGLWKT